MDKEEDKIAVVCVLKSGGDFVASDVIKLKIMLEKNITIPYAFYCLTDLLEIACVNIIPLLSDFKGWWSKIELFRPNLVVADRIVYFDLDTVIVGNIDDLLLQTSNFMVLRPFNPQRAKRVKYFGSGILGWKNNGSFDFLFKNFNYKHHTMRFRGDQDYLSWRLCYSGWKFTRWQDLVSGIYSYKQHVLPRGLEDDARVVCFHGEPRPSKVPAPWIKKAVAL